MKHLYAALVLGASMLAVSAPANAADDPACEADAVKTGKRVFNQCKACHRVEEGKNAIGPSLYAIVGREIAMIDGFRYSKAMKGYAEANTTDEGPATWTVERLDTYIANPKAEVKGTNMQFAGIRGDADSKRGQQRAALICYLKTIGAEEGEGS